MSDKEIIGVIGQGFVGGSITTVFSKKGFIPLVYDKAGVHAPGGKTWLTINEKTRWINSIEELVNECERSDKHDIKFSGVYFVCVPTPMNRDGSVNLSIVTEVLDELARCGTSKIAVIKSTIPPGTTEAYNKKYKKLGLTVVFNPEFLTEANALNDMENQTRIIVGGPRPGSSKVKRLFSKAFPNVPIIKTGSKTAEMVKYFTNTFLMTKVLFANEIFQICEEQNIDYDKVVEYALHDTRIGGTHLSVPGPDGSFGASGSCFPKDINGLIRHAESLGVDAHLLKAVWEKNLEVRPERDWENLKGRAVVDDE